MIIDMQKFLGIVLILALVMTTSFAPSMSHAMSHDGAKAVQNTQTKAAKGHDCHGHGEAKGDSQKNAQNDNGTSDKCCDKGMCKCVGGNCHSLSKYLGNGGNSISAVSTSSLVFAFDSQFVDSALPNRLKRPPKA
ncbi:hypothetical protein GC177_00875 [bacterium]|nr:hypothetical protein [bacterium]